MKQTPFAIAVFLICQFLACQKEDAPPVAVCEFSLKAAPVFEDNISQNGCPTVSLDVETDDGRVTFIFSASRPLVALTACAVVTSHPDECRFFDLKKQFVRDGKIFLPVSEDVADCFALQSQRLFNLTFRVFC